jgi:hypothetical protein
MSSREFMPFVFAFIAGFGGLVDCLAGLDMIEALDRLRPPHDQIPAVVTSLESWAWWVERGPFARWQLWKEYRRHSPGSRTYFWHLAGLTWMLFFVAVAAILLVLS